MDQLKSIQLYHDFREDTSKGPSFRMWIIILTNIIPTVFLVFDMIMSKIRYPPRLAILGYVHIVLWLILTYVVQITTWPEDLLYKPVYNENLNWICKDNFSHLFNEDKTIP